MTHVYLFSDDDDDDESASGAVVKSAKGKKLPPNVAAAKLKIPEVTISADAQPDLKKALEVIYIADSSLSSWQEFNLYIYMYIIVQVIEYAMKVTNGSVQTDVVPLAVRYPMLQMWVLIKQLLQQQISKSLGISGDDEV